MKSGKTDFALKSDGVTNIDYLLNGRSCGRGFSRTLISGFYEARFHFEDASRYNLHNEVAAYRKSPQ
jgi:hypothetical protein